MVSHDKKINKLYIYWLFGSLSLIFLMIIIGGLTRLTNSGLSITEWELFRGIIPPLNKTGWENYFEAYKKIPQFKMINPTMDLSEFKIIFYWEYVHRILGRVIGLFIIIPLFYFHFVKKIKFKKLIHSYLVLILVLFQGSLGWYMVQSGLTNDVTVSHYRLSLHLVTAIIIISILFWQILNFRSNKIKVFLSFSFQNFPFIFLVLLILLQIIIGAFVSGLDAGRIYQTWPLMGDNFFPDDVNKNTNDLFDLKNHSIVQFYHRNIAYFITLYIISIGLIIFNLKIEKLYRPLSYLLIILFIQIILGIFTLLSGLNIALASAHQISSVILVLSALNLYYSIIK